MISQTDFETINKQAGRGSTLEEWAATSDEQIAAGQDVPDGGSWDAQIIQVAPTMRMMVRNYCEWHEITLPDGSKGINISAHAPNADRFL